MAPRTARALALLVATLGAGLVASETATAQGIDFESYDSLLDASIEAHNALEYSDGATARVLDAARSADLALIRWLDEAIRSPDFADLAASDQHVLVAARSRVEFNLAGALMRADRCEEARERLRTLFDSGYIDEELRPRLVSAYDEAVDCADREPAALLTVRATPNGAQVIVSGDFVGLAGVAHGIPLGAHEVTVRADGHEAQSFEVVAREDGEALELGPVNLRAIEYDAGKPPLAGEWALWGVGLAGLATGTFLLIDAAQIEGDLESALELGSVVLNEEEVRDEVDTKRVWGYVAGGVGLTAAIVGTVLYVTRDAERASPAAGVSVAPALFGDAMGAVLSVPLP
jgi:hypothetical protein